MSLAYLVDKDWVIDHFHGVEVVTRKLEELRPAGLAISVVSLAELYEGIHYSRDPARLREFARWLEQLGGTDLPIPPDPTVLWAIFKRDYERRAGAVFLALSFHENQTLKDVGKAIKEAVARFNEEHTDAPLTPVRVDEQRGGGYEIPARVFQDIDRSELLIADLTDELPNVYCEVGYAKSRGIPFVLTFHKKDGTVVAPWDRESGGNRVHFDLAAFRHIAYDNPLDLRDKLKVELDAWFLEGHAP